MAFAFGLCIEMNFRVGGEASADIITYFLYQYIFTADAFVYLVTRCWDKLARPLHSSMSSRAALLQVFLHDALGPPTSSHNPEGHATGELYAFS